MADDIPEGAYRDDCGVLRNNNSGTVWSPDYLLTGTAHIYAEWTKQSQRADEAAASALDGVPDGCFRDVFGMPRVIATGEVYTDVTEEQSREAWLARKEKLAADIALSEAKSTKGLPNGIWRDECGMLRNVRDNTIYQGEVTWAE